LHYDCAICESDELSIDLVNPSPGSRSQLSSLSPFSNSSLPNSITQSAHLQFLSRINSLFPYPGRLV
jgi:hypothetical protein